MKPEEPTPMAVAEILTCPMTTKYRVEADGAFQRLIGQSAKAAALWQELTAKQAKGPTLLQFARFLLSFEDRPYRDTYPTAWWLVRQSDVGCQIHEKLERQAAATAEHLHEPGYTDYIEVLQAPERVENKIS